MKNRVMITTIDNPFNPFDDFTSWFMFDIEKGYYTCSKLARLMKITNDMTQKEEDEEIERVVNRLVEIDPLDIYKIVEKQEKIKNNQEKIKK